MHVTWSHDPWKLVGPLAARGRTRAPRPSFARPSSSAASWGPAPRRGRPSTSTFSLPRHLLRARRGEHEAALRRRPVAAARRAHAGRRLDERAARRPLRSVARGLRLVPARVLSHLARVVLALLLIAGMLLVLAAAVLAYRAIPDARPPPEPPPAPVPPVASPLEQALALLEAPAAANGAQDRRRALELVADEVERLGDGARDAARALAWSEDAPEGDSTRVFASRATPTNGEPEWLLGRRPRTIPTRTQARCAARACGRRRARAARGGGVRAGRRGVLLRTRPRASHERVRLRRAQQRRGDRRLAQHREHRLRPGPRSVGAPDRIR